MHRPTALLALSGALALAAESSTTVVDLWMPFLGDLEDITASPPPLSASVVGADSKATIYALGCIGGTDADECPTEGFTFTQGPSTYALATVGHVETDMAVSETLACSAPGDEDTLVCTATVAESDGTTAVVKHESITTSGFVSDRVPVTLTAGLEKLSATPGAGATNTASDTGTSSSRATATGLGSSQTGKSVQSSSGSNGSSSGSGAAASPTSTSGANAGVLMSLRGVVLVGMGALIGGLML